MDLTHRSRRVHLGFTSIVVSSGSRIKSGKAVSHWVLIVWDGNPENYPLTSELLVQGTCVFSETRTQSQWFPHVAEACKQHPVGHTTMTNEEISATAMSVTGGHGSYSLLSNNCQSYVKRLLAAIVVGKPSGRYTTRLKDGDERSIDLDDNDSRIISNETTALDFPDPDTQYRFKPDAIQMTNMYQSPHPGYIIPSSDIRVVNVSRTDNPEVWQGEVNTTGVTGYVLRSAIERCDRA